MEEMNKLLYKDLFETYQQRACPKKVDTCPRKENT